jgi:APA family basic amino acid/polyamine antiporter
MTSPESTRSLSLFDATMLVMGGIIGVGIFFKPSNVAQFVPSTGPYFAMWVIGAVAALAGAMTFAELAGTFPHTGGWYVFLREGFGRFPAFLFAWIVLLVISTGACATVADFCAQKIGELVWSAQDEPGWARGAIGTALVAGVTGLGLTGIKSAALFQNLCMLAKLLAIGTFIFAGLALFGDAPAPAAAAERTSSTAAGMIRATLPVLFTYGGWQLVTYIGPHVKDAPRNLPRAIVLGVAGVGVVYLLLNAAYVRVLGIDGVATLEDVPATLAQRTLGDAGTTFLTVAMAVSALGFIVATLIATPGIYVAMAREGLFLAAVGRTSPRTGAPTVALSIQGALTIGYLLVSTDLAGDLADSVVFVEWIFHFLVAAALLRVRRTRPDIARPWRSFAYPLFPVLYLCIAAGVVIGNLFQSKPSVTLLGLGVLAVGALVYLPWSRLSARAQ